MIKMTFDYIVKVCIFFFICIFSLRNTFYSDSLSIMTNQKKYQKRNVWADSKDKNRPENIGKYLWDRFHNRYNYHYIMLLFIG